MRRFSSWVLSGILAACLAGCAPTARDYGFNEGNHSSEIYERQPENSLPSDRAFRRDRLRDQKRRADQSRRRRARSAMKRSGGRKRGR